VGETLQQNLEASLTELCYRIEVVAGKELPEDDNPSVLTVHPFADILHCQQKLMCSARLWSEYAVHLATVRTWNASRDRCAGLVTAVMCVKGAAHYIAAAEVLSTEEVNMMSLLADCLHVGP
jgi:hypothetical protein